ncbi:breast carcinoma-amplified sequence 4 isoform X2 [Pteropus medius]|uniref:breast carcinoma-amplified sequence 4 isoform X2 n=1 Tax=Pteropus vampyrus TaxID=132908 RepID=UPI00196B80BA|nr:breast carcinoma-amplified sequence 4 isoform X2 [Pteropus giganteus]
MCATGWRCPLGPALGQARAAAAGCAPAPPPPGGPQGMQPAGGGTPRPGSCDGLPRSLCQLDPAALLMLLVDADRPEPVRSGARELALFLTPEPGAEPLGGQGPAPFCFFAVPSGDARIGTLGEGRTRKKKVRTTVHAKEVEETIEGLLLRLEEFCSLTDMIRSDTSQILEENIPLLKAKVTEMRGIYTKVDQLEAFVKMVGRHVSFLEDHVLQAERDHGAFSQALRRWLGSAGLPRFRTQRPTRVRLGVPGPAPSRVCQTRGPQASLWQLVPGNASQPGMSADVVGGPRAGTEHPSPQHQGLRPGPTPVTRCWPWPGLAPGGLKAWGQRCATS